MSCPCGSTVCHCQGVCRCCPVTCVCRCLRCCELRERRRAYCDHCSGSASGAFWGPIHETLRTHHEKTRTRHVKLGALPNLDFLHNNQPQQSNSGSEERTLMKRSPPQDSRNYPRESITDDPLQFQMDLDDSPTVSTNTCVQPRIRVTEHSQVSSNINILSTRQSQISDMPNRRNVPVISSQTSPNTNIQRLAESYDIEKPSLCNPNILVSEPTETHVSEMNIIHVIPGFVQISSNADVSRPRASYPMETQALCNPSIPVLERTETHVSEMNITHIIPGFFQIGSNVDISRPRASYPIETQALCNPSIPVSEHTESRVSEIPIPQHLPGCSRYNLDEGVSKSDETQMSEGASCMASSPSNEYSSESLTYTLSSDDSPPSNFPVYSRSPSSSEPSICDIPESLKQETLVAPNTFENSTTPRLSKLEMLIKSDSTDGESSTSESSSSIETLPPEMSNRTGNINGHSDLQSACAASALFNSTSIHNTPVQAESVKQISSPTSIANRLKLPSPEISKTTRRRKSSESSIETLSRDPANETSEDEHITDMSPKKEDSPEKV